MDRLENAEEPMRNAKREDWRALTPARIESLISTFQKTKKELALGMLIWLRPEYSKERIEEILDKAHALGIRHLRVGASWADWLDAHKRGQMLERLAACAERFSVLPCLSFTPPGLARDPQSPTNSPPHNFGEYAVFVREFCKAAGGEFAYVELWNEFNLNTDWNPEIDPEHEIFMPMITLGARAARECGKKVVLGGASKVNEETLKLYRAFAAYELDDVALHDVIDVIGFHNLRGTWSDDEPSPALGEQVRLLEEAWGRTVEVWLTEYGFSTAITELKSGKKISEEEMEKIQTAVFAYAVYELLLSAVGETPHPLGRAYWYTLFDEKHVSLRASTTGWEDILQWFFGVIYEHNPKFHAHDSGEEKLLARLLREGGPLNVLRYAVAHDLLPLVDAAALGRTKPWK